MIRSDRDMMAYLVVRSTAKKIQKWANASEGLMYGFT